MQRVPLLARPEFDHRFLSQFRDKPVQNPATQILSGHFSPPKKNCGLDLVPFFQEAHYMLLLGLIVVFIDINAKLYLFDGNNVLVLSGCAFLFFLLVEKFAEVHKPANRRLGGGGNFHQVQRFFPGDLESFPWGHDAELLARVINHANFTNPDPLVRPNKPLIDASLLENGEI